MSWSLQVLLDLLDELVLVRTVRVEPENRRHAGLRAQVTASLTQSRIGASLTWHMRQMSPCSTFCVRSTSPVAMSTMLAMPSSAISKVLSWEPFPRPAGHQADVGHGAHGLRDQSCRATCRS